LTKGAEAGSAGRLERIRPIAAAILCLAVFLSRMPFIAAGYGADTDAWRVAVAAKMIAKTGQYAASRLPGYPIPELTYSLFWGRGPLFFNGVTALFSALSALIVALIMRRLGSKEHFYGAVAFAFAPVVYISSTTSMDYMWAAAFLLGGVYLALDRRPAVAGVLLGLAAGCRMTSLLMLIPLSVLIAGTLSGRRAMRGIITMAAAALVVGGATYLPALMLYGAGLFKFYRGGVPTSAVHLLSADRAVSRVPGALFEASVGTWGIVGCAAVVAALAVTLFGLLRHRERSDGAFQANRTQNLAWLAAVCLFSGLFLTLPDEAGYLIPAVPFVILLLASAMRPRTFKLMCAGIALSPFLAGVYCLGDGVHPRASPQSLTFDIGGRSCVLDLAKGPVVSDHSVRIERMAYVDRVIRAANSLDHRSLIAAGSWYYELEADPRRDHETDVEYMARLDLNELRRRLREGYAIYYLPGEREKYIANRGVDLRTYGAEPLIPGRGAPR
jgi:hypothetical protein